MVRQAKTPQEALEQVKIALMKRSPAYYFLLSYMRVVYIDRYGQIASAATDGKQIVLFKEWMDANFEERYAIIKHELAHVFYKHSVRIKRLIQIYGNGIHLPANLIADGIVNVRIVKDEPGLRRFLEVDWIVKHLGYDSEKDFWKMSLEELIEKYIDKLKKLIEEGKIKPDKDIDPESSIRIPDDATELQEGEPELVNSKGDELEKKITKYIERAVVSAKNAGRGMGTIEREMYDKLFKPKIDWVSKIMSLINGHVRQTIVQTWVRPSRKGDYSPGYISFTKPKVFVLDDESGSIGSLERKRFYSEMVGILSVVEKIKVIVWDDGIRHIFELSSEEDVKRMRTRAGGGTVISPVLEHLIEKEEVQSWDVVVVMTDGYWFDIDRAVNLLLKIPAKKILVTTGQEVPGFDEVIKIDNVEGEYE